MIRTPWTVELQDDQRLGYGIREEGGQLVAVGMMQQDAQAACIAMNKLFPKGSPQCRAPGILAPDYSKPYQPDPRKPRIA